MIGYACVWLRMLVCDVCAFRGFGHFLYVCVCVCVLVYACVCWCIFACVLIVRIVA